MPFEMVRNDLTRMQVDAIVNAANTSLLGGGGVDGAIHRAAGPELKEECAALGGCRVGQAKITGGYRLPARYVIHTVGPVWSGGSRGEEQLLSACYRNALELARTHGCESVAFPLISSGAYGYPKEQALSVAVDAITGYLQSHDDEMTVYLVLFGSTAFLAGKRLFRDVQAYIDDVYVSSHEDSNLEARRRRAYQAQVEETRIPKSADFEEAFPRPAVSRPQKTADAAASDFMPDAAASGNAAPAPEPKAQKPARKPRLLSGLFPRREKESAPPESAPEAAIPGERAPQIAGQALAPDWEALLRQTDEGFSQALLRLIDERGMTDAQCYKKANVDRKLFSKIRSNPGYKPSKATVCAFAIALELTLPEADELLRKAGFALSHSSRFDIILEYFFQARYYNIYEINQVLFAYDMPLLGSGMM